VAQTLRITGDYPQGNYKFTGSVTDVNGCVSSFFDVFLEMNTMPAPPTIGNITQPTCALATGSIALTGLPSGNWTINPGNITGTGASYTVSGLAAGTYNYTVNNGQCTSVASTDVVINTQPVTPAAPVVGTITQPTCVLATGSVVLNGLPSGNWTINPGGITGSGISTTLSGLATGTYNFTVNNGQCTSVATPDVVINTQPVTPAAPMVGTITQPTCILATGSVVLNGLPSGNWTINPGNITGTGASYTVSGLAAGTYNYTVNNGQCTSVASTDVVINTQPVTPAAPVVGTITQPTCAVQSGSVVLDGLPSGNWTINPGNVSGSTVSTTISGLAPGTYNFDVTNASGCTSAASANVDISANLITTAEAGPTVIYYGTPVQIGVVNNGSGTIIWSPATGLNDPGIAQPLASPATTTTYTITVDNNGCVRTDTVTVVYGGIGHMIAGKTRYLKMATAGNPAPNPPTYSPAIYNIDNVEVILKSSPGGAVIATTVSNANGEYQFTGVPDGDYILAYDHIPYPDTMQYVNHTNAVDLALLKYYVGHNPLTDPSRNFSEKHRKAANVDNNASINTVDVARISGKIGMPNDPAKNFPKGNWVAFDTLITMAGSDLNITLQTVAYGDYNASSVKYQGAATNWGMVKELPDENIIVRSDESIMMSDPDYFEVPLRISTKMNELSAVGLELSYPSDKYKLVSASMSNTGKKGDAIKINPTLEEIIAANNDLLVTDIDGVIRVVFATTDHFDIAANEELVKLGFRSLIDPGRGELDFNLNGTGLIANQYGEINADAYLTMPKIFVQGDDMEAGFELAGYPNPFSGDATLTYSIPENGTVKLSVYNAIGELVALLVNESQISGKHSAVFSPVNLPAGMYTFKLEFTGSDKSKLMVLKMVH
ncbi:MAG TPA: T9SS type A sorting domain-containing protein, partial [Paludibacteraceae bacterium]|nr:T9SS type A sorting domain-containing protein [Paludibacteraceae bacterium]